MPDEKKHYSHSREPLSPEENREVRVLLEADRRTKWLWSMFRTVATTIAVLAGTIYAIGPWLRSLFKAIGPPQ